MSINSVHLNKNQSLLTAKLEMQSGSNTIVIPYKIDTGSKGNIMPLFIIKKKCYRRNKCKKKHKKPYQPYQGKTYNKTSITQLGMCVVVIKFRNIRKDVCFFVVLGNGQALLRMPDTPALKLIHENIDFIQTEVAECKTNTGNVRKSNITQETHVGEKGCADTDADSKSKHSTKGQNNQDNAYKVTNYFLSSPNREADKRKSVKLTQEVHNTFGDVFNEIGCFKGTFSLQFKPDSKLYQAPTRYVVHTLQKPFKEELEWLQKKDIIAPLGIDESTEWCNSFVFVPNANGKVRLCLDLARLNQVLTRPNHRGPTLNDILPKLNNVKYMSIIDASSGYHNLH